MKSTLLFVASLIAVILISISMANADEKKTITPQEFAQTISEVPNKVGNFLTSEVEKTKAYQKETWSKKLSGHPCNCLCRQNGVCIVRTSVRSTKIITHCKRNITSITKRSI